MSECPGLELKNIHSQIGEWELVASFEIFPEDRVGITGRSGIGKTSLLRIIAGLETPKNGDICLNSKSIVLLPPHKRNIGMVFQEPRLFPNMSVLENVSFPLKMRGVSEEERYKRGQQALEKIQLGGMSHRSIEKLSGGEMQRIALARSMIFNPDLLLLDEPFSGLDSTMKALLQNDLLRWLEERPIPLIIVSHDDADMSAITTQKIAFKESGKLRLITSTNL